MMLLLHCYKLDVYTLTVALYEGAGWTERAGWTDVGGMAVHEYTLNMSDCFGVSET